MSLLSKLTLVIPTYNRQRYVLRNMRFLSGSQVMVHVLDGSEQAIPAKDMPNLAGNVTYHHLPIPVLERLQRAVDLVQTEYVALLADDEFFLPDALQACIQELEADEALVSCMGRCLAFQSVSKQIVGWPAYTEMANYSVLQDDPIARMIHHMNPYTCSTIFSIIRTPIWRQALAILARRRFSVFALGENQFELAVCYHGKSKVIEDLMWLRSLENDGIRDEHDIVTFHQWWADKDKSNDREEFLTLMASALAHGDARKHEAVREGIKAACNSFYEWLGGDRRGFYEAASKRIPPAVKALIKKILAVIGVNRYAPAESGNKPLLQAAKDLESTGVRVNYEQLSQVVELVQQFHGWKVEQ